MTSLERQLHSIYNHNINQPTCILIYDSTSLAFDSINQTNQRQGTGDPEKIRKTLKMLHLISLKNMGWL